jgi:hypothetical protein
MQSNVTAFPTWMGLAANLTTASVPFTSLIECHLCDFEGSSEEGLGRQWPYAMNRRPKVSFELAQATKFGRLLALVSG